MNTPIKHELCNGTIAWRLPNGHFHREDGPSVIYPDGTMFWFTNGELNRTNGPAVVYPNGDTGYWLAGQQYDPITFLIKIHEYTNDI